MNSALMAAAPGASSVAVMDQPNQANNMYYRTKNPIDEKVSQSSYAFKSTN